MEKRAIFILIFIVLIVVAGVLIYIFYEKPVQEETEKSSNLSIFAVNYKTQNKIRTGFSIVSTSNSYFKNGNTSEFGNILVSLPFNQSFDIFNVNLENQKYYSEKKSLTTSEQKVYAVKLDLRKPGDITLERKGNFDGIDNLSIVIKAEDFYQQIKYCLKWGLRVVKIDSIANFTKIEKPQNYSQYFECYDTGVSLERGETLEIPLKYKYWETLGDEDYIKIVVMDSDFINGEYLTELNEKDIGGENKVYEIRF